MKEIKVQFFGKFNIVYDGVLLVGEKVHKESQFNRLLLALLHAWPNGVNKDELESFVIGEKETSEEHTALRIIIYKAKKKLVKLGLPDINLIYQEKGMVYWSKEIPVVSDCKQMEQYYAEAEAAKTVNSKEDIEKSMLLYMDAAYLYKGEFLEMYGAEIQVAYLAKKYRKLFVACINNASKMLEKLRDWDNLENLGRFAVLTQPLCNWEILVMEALVQKRKYEDATTYYADVVDFYLKKCGIYPSDKLIAIMDEMEDSIQQNIGNLDAIQESLMEKEEYIRGGYYCSFPIFKGVYQMMVRQMERTGQNAYLMLCSLVDKNKRSITDEERLETLSEDMKETIAQCIRRGDIFTRYGKGQYLVFLINTSVENCEIVKRRVDKVFGEKGYEESIKYHIGAVN